jgi:hypothetical protein
LRVTAQAAWTERAPQPLTAITARFTPRRAESRRYFAHTMLIIAYTMLKTDFLYRELGGAYLE